MFICGFIGILKLTHYNHINLLFSFIGMSFAISKFLDAYILLLHISEVPIER